MPHYLIVVLILFPIITGGLCLLNLKNRYQQYLVYVTSFVIVLTSIIFALWAYSSSPIVLTTVDCPINISYLMNMIDYLVLGIIIWIGFKHKHFPIICFSFFQILLLTYLENKMLSPYANTPFIYIDSLAIIMVLIVSIIGAIICLFALPYMQNHLSHTMLNPKNKGFFFGIMLIFMVAMNGLVLSNNILFLYAFFEITTLCSFWLIGFDRTFAATKNALQALWMNSLGGLALLISITLFYMELETLDIHKIITVSLGNTAMMLPLCMLILSAFIKSAQPPFQSWLLGAMVAPTPVSALLHSSTMVKIGVYMSIRFAPAYMDSFLSISIAIFGSFVFLSAAFSAIGQSNGKKVLAYSTISNLGLIFACAGVGTPESITAGIVLIIFHAVSKALLFLCTGTIEQKIGSRNIEDMRGINKIMPFTSLIMVIAIVSIILPPFGMLIGKWMALEAVSAINLPVVILLGIGSSATLLYWTRWAGLLLNGDTYEHKKVKETTPFLIKLTLTILCIFAIILSLLSPIIFKEMILPITSNFGLSPFRITDFGLQGYQGAFWLTPLFITLLIAVFFGLKYLDSSKHYPRITPFMCGINSNKPNTFKGPMNKIATANVFNYYFMGFCKETTSLRIFNIIALIIMIIMLGGSINYTYNFELGGSW